jgi:hypothetical protein
MGRQIAKFSAIAIASQQSTVQLSSETLSADLFETFSFWSNAMTEQFQEDEHNFQPLQVYVSWQQAQNLCS